MHLYRAISGYGPVLPPIVLVLVFSDLAYGIAVQCGLYQEGLCVKVFKIPGLG
jgi:hypothetical protein